MRLKVNDISINYEIGGNGKTLVLIHGIGGNLQKWDPVKPFLYNNFRVLTWDVRGHGKSDKPAGDYSAGMFASDLADLLAKLNIESAFVLGHSMGGVIAERFALDFPHLCRALIVSSSSAEVNPQATKYWQNLAARVIEEGMPAITSDPTRLFSKGYIEKHPNAVVEFTRSSAENDPNAYARAALAMASYNYNQELGNIRCPTLIMVGDQDLVTPPGGSVKMSRLIPGSKLVIFRDCGHLSYMEQPQLFSQTVIDFL